MNRYTRRALEDTPYFEEPYYNSSAYLPEDLICEGSDNEQSEQEIRAKRKRYEEHARRYTRGFMPTLQSTSLTHSLDNWSNPWRKQSHIRERPAARVAHCHTPELNATDNRGCEQDGTTEGGETGGPDDETRYSSLQNEQIRSTIIPASEGSLASSSWATEQNDTMMLRQSHTQNMDSRPNAQISNNDTSPHSDDEQHTGLQSRKRGGLDGNPTWLKGSYPSKRARWEGPSLATPTPNLAGLNSRIQRPRPAVRREPGDWDSTQHLSSPNPFASFQDIPRKALQNNNQEGLVLPPVQTPLSGNYQISKQPLTLPGWTPDFQPLYSNTMVIHDQEITSEPPTRIGPSQRSRHVERRYTESPVERETLSYDPIRLFPLYKTPGSIAGNKDLQSTGRYTLPLSSPLTDPRSRAAQTTSREKGDLVTKVPALLHSSVKKRCASQPGMEEGNSFVTEVAAASQNLEEFQYRKRRPKKEKSSPLKLRSSEHEHQAISIGRQSLKISQPINISGGVPELSEAASEIGVIEQGEGKTNTHQAIHLEIQEAEVENSVHKEHGEDENVLASGPIALWYTHSSPKKSCSIQEEERSSENEETDGEDSSDHEDEVGQSLHNLRDILSQSSSPVNDPPEVVVSIPEEAVADSHISASPILSSLVPVSQLLPNSAHQISRKYSPEGDDNAKVETSRCIYDFSTQSFNTTPQRSAIPQLSQGSSVSSRATESHSQKRGRDSESVEQAPLESPFAPLDDVLGSGSSNRIVQSGEPDVILRCRLSTSPHTSDPASSPVNSARSQISGSISSIGQDDVEYVSARAPPEAVDLVVVDQIHSKTPVQVSQVLQPEEQSPWAVASIVPPYSNGIPSEVKHTQSIDHDLHDREAMDTTDHAPLEDTSWQHIERPQTPENDDLRPFNDLMTPPPQLSAKSPDASEYEPQNTQDLIEAATNNPWKTPKRNPAKPGKRVSFGILEEEEEKTEPVRSRSVRRYSPPPLKAIELFEEETLADGTIASGFKKHFSAIRNPRRLILENSITNNSPSVGAMAEAFVTADQEAPKEASRGPSRYLKPRTTNVMRWDDSEDLEDSISNLNSPTKSKGDGFQTNFNMDDVLGEVADFLGEWSVEADIQKARELNKTSEAEDNGAKRRRLFGIT
ncbi:hypothetical protein HYALB_00005565 [Hymenoscyphus albidus]|uniref:Protamine P1 n=1 Tax=Hymenoscyphus albidus TaxID=595503 RepID=A0A9N9LED9_9HELO|nr:hypothetical protein HYALB_00005565 [Hymenoscyphus albidus]